MVGTRDTPPSIQDGPFGFEPASDGGMAAELGTEPRELDDETARKLALECYEASTNWINSGRRAKWNDNLRAFQSLHPSGSKYNSREFSYRSRMFRPKTRSIVRRAEMQTAQAFFSNEDVVDIRAQDDNDPKQQASAAINKALLNYRLTHSIPWFLTLIGARQDCEVMGICVAKAYWNYEEKFSHTEQRPVHGPDGMPQPNIDGTLATEDVDVMERVHDKPVIDLISPENFRFEPGCDWRDPIGSSPYIIELMPMYVADVRDKMDRGEWLRVPTSALRAATDRDDDVTRRARETGRVPGKDHDAWKPRDFDVCWVRSNIIKWQGEDWQFYTLASAGELLTEPRPLREIYLHGERPYVCGFTVLETHKTYPSAKAELVRDLQHAANDMWNLRFDNIKLNLNPRQFIRTGVATELSDVRTFMPGKVIVVNTKASEDVRSAIQWDRPPPMDDAAAYQEQDRINLDLDELTGAFTNSSVQSSQLAQQSATGMHLMSGEASGINEYELRCFAETFVEPLLRLMLKIEQAYEVDPVILAIAGKNANLYQKYGIDQITDELIEMELTTKVNVGVGASNPQMRLRNFVSGADILGKIFGPSAAQGANFQEIAKEIFGMLGYKDGSRFFQPNFDPRVAMLQQQLNKHGGGQAKPSDPQKLQIAQLQAQERAQTMKMKMDADLQMTSMDADAKIKAEQMENLRTMAKLHSDHALQGRDHSHDAGMAMAGFGHDASLAQAGQQHDMGMASMGQDHDAAMAGAGQQFDAAMSQQQMAMQPKPAAAAPQTAPAGGDPNAILQHMMSVLSALASGIAQGNSQLAQAITQGNQSLGAALQQNTREMAQALAQVVSESHAPMMASMHQIAQSHAAMAQAAHAPKRLVRGPDGRALGVETVQ